MLLRDLADYELLVDTLRGTPKPTDLDTVIGERGPIAASDLCNRLMVPIVSFDQIYSFDRDSLMQAIPRPTDIAAGTFAPAAESLFDRVMRMTDNAGARDEHKALNYLVVRYHRIYGAVFEAFGAMNLLAKWMFRCPL